MSAGPAGWSRDTLPIHINNNENCLCLCVPHPAGNGNGFFGKLFFSESFEINRTSCFYSSSNECPASSTGASPRSFVSSFNFHTASCLCGKNLPMKNFFLDMFLPADLKIWFSFKIP